MPDDTRRQLELLTSAVVAGDGDEAVRLTQGALECHVAPLALVEDGLVAGMAIIGEQFKRREAFLPELLIAARAMKEAMAIVEPLLAAAGDGPRHTAVIGTVEGDLHDIGKNLVLTMWQGANMKVVDLGSNVPAERFVETVRESGARLVGISSLLTTTMPAMHRTVEAVRSRCPERVKVVVGGAPISRAFATEIGADGFARDAATAVDVALELLAS